jgi:hypothetical protein
MNSINTLPLFSWLVLFRRQPHRIIETLRQGGSSRHITANNPRIVPGVRIQGCGMKLFDII